MKKIKTGKHYKLFFVLIFIMVFAYGYAIETITVENAHGNPGSQVNVNITCTNAASVAGMNFAITFDPTVISNIDAVKGALVPNDFSFEKNKKAANEFRFLFYKDPTGNITTGAGTIAVVTLTISAGANGGQTSPINIDPANFGVSNDQGVSTTGGYAIVNGTLTVDGPTMPITDTFDPNNTWVWWPTAFSGITATDKYETAPSIGFTLKEGVDLQGAAWYRNFAPAPKIPVLANNIYKATLRLRSDITKDQVPEFRFRAHTLDNLQKSVTFGIVSAGDGAFSPGATATNYNAYFVPAETAADKENLLIIDLIRRDPADASTGNFFMDQFSLTRTPLSNLTNKTDVEEFTFEADEEGWAHTVWAGPTFSYGNGKLTVTGPEGSWGFYQNNPSVKPITLQANKLYKVIYKISTTQTDIEKVCQFRTRVNALDFQGYFMEIINSMGTPSIVPDAAGKDFPIYFVPQDALIGDQIILAVDFLNLTASGDSGDLSIENVKVETYDVPTMF